MSIPKTIYQTFSTGRLPLITSWHISTMRKKNPEYTYEFYDDARICDFIHEEFGCEIFRLFNRIDIGAARADFFRYAILYKKGGVYLDLDSLSIAKLDSFILPADTAVISMESHPDIYLQWALIFSPGHPFLKRTLEIIINNLKKNLFPHDVHRMTGPTAYTAAINSCLLENPDIPHRVMGIDYNGCFRFHYPFAKFFMYSGNQHWKKAQLGRTVLKQ